MKQKQNKNNNNNNEKTWIPAFPLCKPLSRFACPGHFLGNDFIRGWLDFKSYLPGKKIYLSRTTERDFFRALNPTRLGYFYNVCAEFYRHIVGHLNERFTPVILKSSYCARVRKTVANAFKLRL